MAKARKIHDEADARRCLRAAERAGRSAGDWARAQGVDGRSLQAWKNNLARRGTGSSARGRRRNASPPARGLVEIVPAQARAAPRAGARYVLEVAGARVEFGDDCSAATLRRVLEALRPC